MGIYAKKSLSGYREVSAEDADYYIETIAEHRQKDATWKAKLQHAISSKEHVETELSCVKDELKKMKDVSNASVQKETAALAVEKETRIKELEGLFENALQEKKKAEDLNQNLLRIARERANAKRNLHPKKEKDGYLVLSCRQVQDHHETTHSWEDYQKKPANYRKTHLFKEIERIPVVVWKAVIQTPFDAALPVSVIRDQIFGDLEAHLLTDIGCLVKSGSDSKNVSQRNREAHVPEPIIKHYFTANAKTGLWEMEIFTPCEMIIPIDRR